MSKSYVKKHLWCESCRRWFDYPDDAEFPSNCPLCGKQIVSMRCNRCGHTWNLRKRRFPVACANRSCKDRLYARQYVWQMRGDTDPPTGRQYKSIRLNVHGDGDRDDIVPKEI